MVQFAYSSSKPWRQPIYQNKLFFYSLIIVFCLDSFILIAPGQTILDVFCVSFFNLIVSDLCL